MVLRAGHQVPDPHRPLRDRVPEVRSRDLWKPGHVGPSTVPDLPAHCFGVNRELDGAGGSVLRLLESYEREPGRAGQLIVTGRPLESAERMAGDTMSRRNLRNSSCAEVMA